MPYIVLKDVKIYYELHGPENGTPLLLFEGWGYDSWMWFRQIPEFSKEYKCIVVDNRGVGKSSKPDYPYEMQMFANDALAVLDHLKIKKTHVLGISMGGYIAQEFVISYPEKVISLIIASSSFGGPNAIKASDDVQAKLFASPTETLSNDQAYQMRMSVVVSKEWLHQNKKLMDEIRVWREQNPQPIYASVNQAHASSVFNVEDKVGSIKVPTLIIHGSSDRVVPPKNAQLLHDKIQKSKLVFIDNGQHWSFIEQFNEFNQNVLDFLEENSN